MSDAKKELAEYLAREHPADYARLMAHQLPPGWTPDPVMAAQVLTTMQRDECRTCKTAGAPMQCSQCGLARYCSVDCQRLDWDKHKEMCQFDRLTKAFMKEIQYSGHLDVATDKS